MKIKKRVWPSKLIEKTPIWCSVDLRDGNQALVNPMTVVKKKAMFEVLVELGFNEIEVGFPSASLMENEFLRQLIDQNLIPDDVTVQILCQARRSLIEKSFSSFSGARRVIFHLYNSTSTLQRQVVFNKSKKEVIELAVKGVLDIKELSGNNPETEVILQYSPESFTGTEMPFALEICESVIKAWDPKPQEKVILNLPATVEMSTPNVYADQIEWFISHLNNKDQAIISIHPHNDRGTAVAAAELALMAGAERVEGTLFGNGERTGNVDIITMAMNLLTQGIDPDLKINDINRLIKIYEDTTEMKVHPRHPYAGELVFTAFSGSHQDAISKGLAEMKEKGAGLWEVPYLPLDPGDIGRKYEKVIRINSQSGKGGFAFVLERDFGLRLPRGMRPEFGEVFQRYLDSVKREVAPEEIYQCFKKEYLLSREPFELLDFREYTEENTGGESPKVQVRATLRVKGKRQKIQSSGSGPIDAFVKGLSQSGLADFRLIHYEEHTLEEGSDSKAVAFIGIGLEENKAVFGAGEDSHIAIASAKAVVSALNRYHG